MAEKQPKLYLEQFQAAERRFVPFIANRFVRSILGQSKNTLDLKHSMDEGEILLVDLSREGGYVPPESSQIIGRLLVNNLVARAYERTPGKSRAFNLYIDEVQNYLSGDVPEILSQCRKFGLHLTIAHQYLQQLREAGELVYHGVMGTARNKVCFALDNPEDAEIMQRRIFVGKYDFERAKESLIKPTVVGHEIIKLWSEGRGTNESTTDTRSQNLIQTKAEGHGFLEGFSSGTSSGQTKSSADIIGMLDGEELAVTRHSQSTADVTSESSGENYGSSKSYALGSSEGEGASQGETTGTSQNQSYSESLQPVFADLPTAVYSLEEQKHIFTDMVISLPSRSAFAVLAGAGMAQIETLDVPDLIISGKRKNRIISELKANSGVHKQPKAIEQEIRSRFRDFMATAESHPPEPIVTFDPMASMIDESDIEPP